MDDLGPPSSQPLPLHAPHPFCPGCIWIHDAQPVRKAVLSLNLSKYVCSREHAGKSNSTVSLLFPRRPFLCMIDQ